jgi:hypothetical protein
LLNVSLFLLGHFFAAGGAFGILEKLHLCATAVGALHHKACAALFALLLHKRGLTAGRARDIQRPSAAGTNGKAFLHGLETGWAQIPERTPAAAARTKPRVTL